MDYTIIGEGPQFPKPYELRVSGAIRAKSALESVKVLCGSARAFEVTGREVSWRELASLALDDGN